MVGITLRRRKRPLEEYVRLRLAWEEFVAAIFAELRVERTVDWISRRLPRWRE